MITLNTQMQCRTATLVKKILLDENITNKSNKNNKPNWVHIVKYIVENFLELTPEEYDKLYSTTFNQQNSLDYVLRKLVNEAPAYIKSECLFSAKRIVFRLCWTDYYETHFERITSYDIITAQKNVKGDLRHASKNCGRAVDQLIYKAIQEVFPAMFSCTTEELFIMLSNPKKSGIACLGCIKVIMARGCYPSPLDFYMWNSSAEYQWKYLDLYLSVREKANLPELNSLNLIVNAAKKCVNY